MEPMIYYDYEYLVINNTGIMDSVISLLTNLYFQSGLLGQTALKIEVCWERRLGEEICQQTSFLKAVCANKPLWK